MAIGLNHNTETIRPNEDSFLEIGSVYGSARSTAPTGYLLCDGSAISRTVYSRLFNVISTTYGTGNGSTTFNLPDLRGAVIRGVGTSTGYTQNVTVTLGSKDNDGMQGHFHTADQLIAGRGAGGVGIGGSVTDYQLYVINNYVNAPRADSSNNGTPRTGNETKMKNVGMNFFIKF